MKNEMQDAAARAMVSGNRFLLLNEAEKKQHDAALLAALQASAKDKMSPALHGVLAGLPMAIGSAAHMAKAYRDMYIDPGVETSSSKADTRKRAKFTDEQLQQLLRGMNVDEIKTKSHFIK
jgi:hypothetical protein